MIAGDFQEVGAAPGDVLRMIRVEKCDPRHSHGVLRELTVVLQSAIAAEMRRTTTWNRISQRSGLGARSLPGTVSRLTRKTRNWRALSAPSPGFPVPRRAQSRPRSSCRDQANSTRPPPMLSELELA